MLITKSFQFTIKNNNKSNKFFRKLIDFANPIILKKDTAKKEEDLQSKFDFDSETSVQNKLRESIGKEVKFSEIFSNQNKIDKDKYDNIIDTISNFPQHNLIDIIPSDFEKMY